MDAVKPYLVNTGNRKWQMIFGPGSAFTSSNQIIKIAAQFDSGTLDNLKIAAYLYDPRNAAVANASTCEFKIYHVTTPDWTETLIATINGTQLANNYFYSNPLTSSLTPIDFDGGESIMIEATIVRLGQTYRDRIYANHLGVYDSILRLRKSVQLLDILKADD